LGAGQGFNHLFPLSHKYFGFMDLFGRSNIQSPNVQLTMQPASKLEFLLWYYYLMLDTRADTPYTVVMTPFAPGSQPASRAHAWPSLQRRRGLCVCAVPVELLSVCEISCCGEIFAVDFL
jgi:hypothetical protein